MSWFMFVVGIVIHQCFMFDSSLQPVVCRSAHVLYVLFVFV